MKSRICAPRGGRAIADFDGWTLFELPTTATQSFLWQRFKLQAPAGTRRRRGALRAFWLDWSILDGRLARRREAVRLAAELPEIAARLLDTLRARYSRAWLLETGGVTEAEIEPELARLAARRGGRGV